MSFFTTALLGALQYKADITERLVAIVIPNLVRGLRSKVKDYQAAAYMILTQLVTQVTLKEETLTAVIGALTKVGEKQWRLSLCLVRHCYDGCVGQFCDVQRSLRHEFHILKNLLTLTIFKVTRDLTFSLKYVNMYSSTLCVQHRQVQMH